MSIHFGADSTAIHSASGLGIAKQIIHKQDGTRQSTTTKITGNSFTSGYEISNLTITMTPTDATTVFHITGSLCATHYQSYTGKLWVTWQVSGGSEKMITSSQDSNHKSTYAINSATDDTTSFGNAPIPINIMLDHGTTSAITVRIRCATTWDSGRVAINRDLGNNTNSNNDSHGMISALMITEYTDAITTLSETNIYNNT